VSDLRNPTLSIVCAPCSQRGSYNVARLMAQYGDAKLPDLLQTIANWPKARSVSIYDQCKVVYEGLATALDASRNIRAEPTLVGVNEP
jgi:hypothetical protein